MPCVDPDLDAEDAREDAKKINTLTDMLCRLCKLATGKVKFPKDIADWWTAHQADDLLREKEEQRRRDDAEAKVKALKKLTPREKRVLGIL